jgi:hypothetical protein
MTLSVAPATRSETEPVSVSGVSNGAMRIGSALASGLNVLAEHGPRRFVAEGTNYLRETAYRTRDRITGAVDAGDRVLDDDGWDVLLVLDGCRADLFDEASRDGSFPWSAPVETAWSPASHSRGWLRRNFGPDYHGRLGDVGYVTANPFSASALDRDRFAFVDEVWRSGWDRDLGTVPPRAVTDRAVRAWRDGAADRLVVHYMQPHAPFLDADYGGQGEAGHGPETWGDPNFENVWSQLRRGTLDRDRVWADYRRNLELVLEDVTLFLRSVDARVTITADHGNCAGEHGLYGHPPGIAVPELRSVPWVSVEAEDDGAYDPSAGETVEGDDVDREEQLAALGYV